jgi:hypothetical protein
MILKLFFKNPQQMKKSELVEFEQQINNNNMKAVLYELSTDEIKK